LYTDNKHAPDVPHDLKASKQLESTPEIRYPPDSITLMTVNFSDEELNLTKRTILGVAQEISENLSVSVMSMTLIEVQNRLFFLEAIKRYLTVLRSLKMRASYNSYCTTRNQKSCQVIVVGEPSCVRANVT